MQNKLKLAVIALCYAPAVFAQTDSLATQPTTISESAFTLTEAQLGEDEDMSQSVTIINSSSNIYANEVGYLFSPVRFRYRAFDQKFNDVYINGVPMNDMESGQFRFTTIGGLNQQTRNVEFALPFESNNLPWQAWEAPTTTTSVQEACPWGSAFRCSALTAHTPFAACTPSTPD